MSVVRYRLLAICAVVASVDASALRLRAEPVGTEEETGPDGHLTEPWVVAVAVTLGASLSAFFPGSLRSSHAGFLLFVAVVIGLVAGIIILIKWRQARRRRRLQTCGRASEEIVAPRVFHGPYGITSSTRTPSPQQPEVAHVSEKIQWAPLPR
ncbi:hypothetical protein BC628DRAFT_1421486 [Trametes gibbosa]|nr:hypothetical protein BC628DRAFT_1421486 [Trametes gibbosa]